MACDGGVHAAPAAREPGPALEDPRSENVVVRLNGARRGASVMAVRSRPRVRGKFVFVDGRKFYIRGVTYGAFRPDENGEEYTDLEKIERDFAQMAASGMNAVRIPHACPPVSLLDAAQRHGLRVMVGLSCDQYVGYLIDRKRSPDIESIVREKVRRLGRHPALLCYALGNEVPASIVRWLGPPRIERYLQRLYRVVKDEDPDGIVTYVNYPTTEYLRLPFLDLVAFNVYLECDRSLAAYLGRLHHLAGDRPLIMSEIGLDSMRNGLDEQRRSLTRQIRTTFESGLAGGFVFAWTDEWYRGGAEVDDWAFGLTDKRRNPKPALAAVNRAFRKVPFAAGTEWPSASVVVCAYNAGATLRDCLDGVTTLAYPNYEVIVVDDGSSDDTAEIAGEYDCKLVSMRNRGLSAARNVGLEQSTGAIVAYIDADARPDRHWLQYLAAAFSTGEFKGVGGPNIAPAGDGNVAAAVAHSPGAPAHVMLSDHIAEHIPGCNMAFLREELLAAGGFDPRFRIAGDDVDICWRIQERGGTLGFCPAAMVWHHRRNSVRGYWRQQHHYGTAERLLEAKWPQKYNGAGHVAWSGRIYGRGLLRPLLRVHRVYHGLWGSAPFQSLYEREPHALWAIAATPEWWLVISLLLAIGTLGAFWAPLLLALALAAAGVSVVLTQAVLAARRAFDRAPLSLRLLLVLLHVLQPIARMRGRLAQPSARGRQRRAPLRFPRSRRQTVWSERWEEPTRRLERLRDALCARGSVVLLGRDCDRWDLHVRGGGFAGARLVMAVEDHGSGAQYFRFRSWPKPASGAVVVAAVLFVLAAAAALAGATVPAALVAAASALVSSRIAAQSAAATGELLCALDQAAESQ